MWVDLHFEGASKALYANPPDWNEMHAWRRILKPGDLFIDVGSNVGCYALWAADSGAQVIAIEPNRDAVEKLHENVRLNDFPIEVWQCGLASEPGYLAMTSNERTANHLVLDQAAGADDVQMDTLDRILGDRRAAGVKIDVEGAERLVLDGGCRALAEHRIAVLQLEWNRLSERVLRESRKPAADLLSRYGYRFMRPDERGVLLPASPSTVGRDDIFAVVPGYQV